MNSTASNTNKIIIKALLITWFALLSSVGFAQASTGVAIETISTESVMVATENSNNMVSWFMGTKQTPKATINDASASGKKQMINSGVEPNRILMRAFLKKAAAYQSTTV